MWKDGLFEVECCTSYPCRNLEIIYHICVSRIDVSVVASYDPCCNWQENVQLTSQCYTHW
jgi:hypothetical protein